MINAKLSSLIPGGRHQLPKQRSGRALALLWLRPEAYGSSFPRVFAVRTAWSAPTVWILVEGTVCGYLGPYCVTSPR